MPAATPDVTIVVVGSSVQQELERCFASIVDHAALGVRTIYVDNASTDGTLSWLAAEHPEVEVIALPRNEFGAARNHALARLSSRYTMFLDSDAALTPGALPTLVAALEEHPEWGLVAPRLVYESGDLQLSIRRFPPLVLPFLRRPPLSRLFDDGAIVRRHLMTDARHDLRRPVVYAISACHLFRTALVERVGKLDRALAWGGEDIDWCIRIRDAGAEVVFVPEATVVHAYRRLTRSRPFSKAAFRHLASFAALQWKYRRRRRELTRLGDELDRRAATGAVDTVPLGEVRVAG